MSLLYHPQNRGFASQPKEAAPAPFFSSGLQAAGKGTGEGRRSLYIYWHIPHSTWLTWLQDRLGGAVVVWVAVYPEREMDPGSTGRLTVSAQGKLFPAPLGPGVQPGGGCSLPLTSTPAGCVYQEAVTSVSS